MSEAESVVAQIDATLNPPKSTSTGGLLVSAHERLIEDDLDLSLM